jgi:hypothetical protein
MFNITQIARRIAHLPKITHYIVDSSLRSLGTPGIVLRKDDKIMKPNYRDDDLEH